MKIGIDARILQDSLRGQGQYVYYLIKYLLKIDKNNEYILFYNGYKKGKFVFEENIPNLKQIWCGVPGRILKPLWSNMDFPSVEYLIGNVDVFHNPFNFNFTHYTPIPSKAKMVVTFNGMADPSTIWRNYDIEKINNWFKIIADKASKIIVVSGSVKEDLIKRVPDIAQEKIKIIYYGVSEDFKPVNDKTLLNKVLLKYGLLNKRYILYVGASDKNKNLAGLMNAFKKICLKKETQDTFLVLAGKIDEGYRDLIKQAKQLNINEKAIFTDFIGHEDLPFIYNGADLFVLPSFNEWFGIPLIEAMASGIPVAASNTCGIPEVVGSSAVLFAPDNTDEIANTIFGVLENKELKENLKNKGIIRAKNFTWENTAGKTLDIYKEALEK